MTRATTSDELSVTNRTIARLRGELTYQSAFSCKFSHTERYTISNHCTACTRAHPRPQRVVRARDEATIRRDLLEQWTAIEARQMNKWAPA